jgi:leader peptidase (prepilin peptidase) / N-methyltransferase
MSEPIVIVLAKLVLGLTLGAAFGAFASTAALRLANHEDPYQGRSRCDGCKRPLTMYETLPFVGYTLSNGHCRTCQAAINRWHLIGEGAGAVLLASILSLVSWPQALLLGALSMVLLTSSLIDIHTHRLPDYLSLVTAVLCAFVAIVSGTIVSGLLSALLCFSALYGLKSWLDRPERQVIGWGDIKLATALSLGLGVKLPYLLLLSSILGLLFMALVHRQSWRTQRLPFGPFLSAIGLLLLVLPPVSF